MVSPWPRFRVYKEIVPLIPEPPRRRSAGFVGSLAARRLRVHTVAGQGVPRSWAVPRALGNDGPDRIDLTEQDGWRF